MPRIAARIGVDTDEPWRGAVNAGLFLELAQRRGFGCFADFHEAARQGKLALKWWVLPPYQQDPSDVVENDRVHRQPWPIRCHCVNPRSSRRPQSPRLSLR